MGKLDAVKSHTNRQDMSEELLAPVDDTLSRSGMAYPLDGRCGELHLVLLLFPRDVWGEGFKLNVTIMLFAKSLIADVPLIKEKDRTFGWS